MLTFTLTTLSERFSGRSSDWKEQKQGLYCSQERGTSQIRSWFFKNTIMLTPFALLLSQVADELIFALEEEFAAPMVNAATLLAQSAVKSRGFVVPTGSPSLDRLLGGGVYSGEITEVFGLFTTGKTQLAMSLALQAVILPVRTGAETLELGRAWYLDSSASFSPNRMAEMFENNLVPSDRVLPVPDRLNACLDVLDRVHVFDVHSPFQLLSILSQLNLLLEDVHLDGPNTNPQIIPSGFFLPVDNLRLVVVDAFGLLLAPYVSSKHKFGRAIMVEIAQLMKHMAVTYNIVFVVTNHTTNEPVAAQPGQFAANSVIKPALGKHWSYIPSVQLMLKYPDQEATLRLGGRVAELRKSTRGVAGTKANFTISVRGVDAALGENSAGRSHK
jgi:RAD51-like protein 3